MRSTIGEWLKRMFGAFYYICTPEDMADLRYELCRRVPLFRCGISSKLNPYARLRKPDYYNIAPGATALVMATGPSIGDHVNSLSDYVQRMGNELIVIGANTVHPTFSPDYIVALNRKQLSIHNTGYREDSIVIIPHNLPRSSARRIMGKRRYMRAMIEDITWSGKAELSVNEQGVIYSHGGTTATLAAGIALAMGVRNINFAGLDGFSPYFRSGKDIHFHDLSHKDVVPQERSLATEKSNGEILDDIDGMLKSRNGKLKILTPTVFEQYFDESVL